MNIETHYPKVSRLAAQKRLNSIFLWVIIFCAASGSQMEAAAKKHSVLVVPFENISGVQAFTDYEVATGNDPDKPKRTFRIDRYTEAPRAILEDILTHFEEITVVERQRVDALLMESEFGRLSGLVDQEKASRLGKMLGARYIVMGTILDVRAQKKNFSGYGIATSNTQVNCGVRLRMVEIDGGKVVLSKVVRGSASFTDTAYGGTNDSDVAYTVIEAALEQLREDEDFGNKITQVVSPKSVDKGDADTNGIEIEFSPTPSDCDIEIDGIYVGGSPLRREFPKGTTMKVKISKAGFTSWERTITADPNLRVTPQLQPIINSESKNTDGSPNTEPLQNEPKGQ
jgi:curli biogenesis system outer membrane secretion channel CsgG